ncbi:hypothetical protein K2173_000110 [Erythroxylum novogranatense]|uniref:Uncharacterized protein n=1 Tax=Erythroxylum novogranatense TaxID=1862640 RepID=A0AAV8SPC2_9ROSI|nr:hypothetical protein K2173_000110 [Erythroxylum novogranatense]
MNPATDHPPPQLLPPQPPRSSTSCDRHPDEHFTGFCPSCLCERLAVLDHSSSSSSRKPPLIPTSSTAAAALKAIFKPSSSSGGGGSKQPSFFSELRRTKSFSASKNEGFSGVFEPQRRSCDVRGRNTLWTLFNQDDERNPSKKEQSSKGCVGGEVEIEARISTSSVRDPVFESKEEEVMESESESNGDGVEDGDIGKIVPDEPARSSSANTNSNPVAEIIEEEEEEEEDENHIVIEPEQVGGEELKPMKDHIDLDSQTKRRDFKEIAGSFWSAASVFSKKLQKWRQKQKLKKRRSGGSGSATLPVEKPIGRQFRETQSEIADYGFGRRSCDTDPRFSLDAGRISFDDPRYSFDEPRASWDGYLIGRTFPRMPTMLSVVEDAPVNVVMRSDTQIPVEEPPPAAASVSALMNAIGEDESVPGGSTQTREYYSDSSSRRRKSFDMSNSIRKTAAAVVAEIDELNPVSNAKVSPATVDSFHGQKFVVPDKDPNLNSNSNSNSNSLRDDCSESFDMGFRDNASVVGNGERKGAKKSRRWSKAFKIWGFIHRVTVTKDEDDDRYSRSNGVERSFSESWQELRGARNGGAFRAGFNPKVLRSNSSVSWRHSQHFGGSATTFGSARKSNVETNGHARKRRDEFVLERNRSARYSPNNIDNGLLRFYLTPMRNSRRTAWGKSKTNHAHSITRSVLRLY